MPARHLSPHHLRDPAEFGTSYTVGYTVGYSVGFSLRSKYSAIAAFTRF